MYVKILKDGQGNVFTPKVSADSVYLSGVTTTLTTKLGEIQEALGEKLTTPTGGTAGQVLKKAETGYTWADEKSYTGKSGGGITVSGTEISHSNSVTAGTVSEGGDARTLALGGSFNVPSVTYDAHGHVTSTGTTKLTLPSTITKAAHYSPSEEAGSALEADASSTTAATWNTTSLVTGVTLKRDSKGHVTGVAVDSVKMPANPNTDTRYTFAEGTTNGAFSVTPTGGEAQSVPIHGLGSAAYTASSAYAPATHNHDTSYYTKSQVDASLGGKVDKVTGSSLVADTLIAKLSGGAVADKNASFVTGDQVYDAIAAKPDKDTTYTFAEGTTNGAFTVTPSGGEAQTVSIHGLGAAAYKAVGSANGVASLGSDGKIPASQLPSYVDDVIEAANKAALPKTGESGKIYVTLDDNKTYRWSGTTYVEISASIVIGTTTGTAYDGALGAALATTVSTHTGNADIHVTTSNKAAWNAKYDKPSGGIPKTDLASAVQTSLGKADSAVQPAAIANMESTTNKVTSWSATTSDTKYPSEKLVKTSLDGKSDTGHTHSAATTSAAGFMSAADKTKLNGIAEGATKVEAVTADNINAKIKINGTEKTLYTHPSAFTGTPGTFASVTVDKYGHVTSGNAKVAAANISGVLTAGQLPSNVTYFEDTEIEVANFA